MPNKILYTSNMSAQRQPSLKGAWLGNVNHLNFGGHQVTNHISGTADRLRRCQLSSPVNVITFDGLRSVTVDHTHRRDRYSTARPSKRNDL